MYYLRNASEYQNIINQLLPDGYTEKNQQDSDLFLFIKSIAEVLEKRYLKFENVYNNFFIQTATKEGIIKLENDLKLPDEIFDNTQDLDIRRIQVLLKQYIKDFGIVYKEDYIMLAKYLGFDKFDIIFNAKKYSTANIINTIPSIIYGNKNAEQFTYIILLDKNINNNNYIQNEIPNEIIVDNNLYKLNLLLKKVIPSYVKLEYIYSL